MQTEITILGKNYCNYELQLVIFQLAHSVIPTLQLVKRCIYNQFQN